MYLKELVGKEVIINSLVPHESTLVRGTLTDIVWVNQDAYLEIESEIDNVSLFPLKNIELRWSK